MKKRMINKIIVNIFLVSLLMIYSSCILHNDSSIVELVNMQEWNDVTIDTMNNKCNISDHDYNKLTNAPSPFIVSHGKKYYTMEEHIRDWLINRDFFIHKVIDSIFIKCESLTIIEIYKSNYAKYIFKNNDNYYSLKFYDNSAQNFDFKILMKNEIEKFKDLIYLEKTEFIDAIEFSLNYMRIVSVIEFKNNKLEYKINDVWLW